jgi:phage shock protein PspC (stress-responsive transcriptional regulator)
MTRNLFTRDDTFFGICEALGEDFGFHANFLRIALAFAAYFNPAAAVGAYLAMGLLVLISRLIAPNPKPAAAPQAAPKPLRADNETEAENLSIAA